MKSGKSTCMENEVVEYNLRHSTSRYASVISSNPKGKKLFLTREEKKRGKARIHCIYPEGFIPKQW